MMSLGLAHTILSILTIVLGLVVVAGVLRGKRLGFVTSLYFVSALATIITGFVFPGSFGIPKILGAIALAVVLAAIVARYAFALRGSWRAIYAFTAVLSVWSFTFFAVGEAFLRIPFLKELAPTLSELPFWIAEGVVFALFMVLAIMATNRFRAYI